MGHIQGSPGSLRVTRARTGGRAVHGPPVSGFPAAPAQ